MCVCVFICSDWGGGDVNVWVGSVRGNLERAGGRKFILWLQNIEDKLRKCCANVQGSAAHARTHTHTGFYHLGGLLSLPQAMKPPSHSSPSPTQTHPTSQCITSIIIVAFIYSQLSTISPPVEAVGVILDVKALIFYFKEAAPLHSSSGIINSYSSGFI